MNTLIQRNNRDHLRRYSGKQFESRGGPIDSDDSKENNELVKNSMKRLRNGDYHFVNGMPVHFSQRQLIDPPPISLPPPIISSPSAQAAYENKILVERVSITAILPSRQSEDAAGYDLYSDVDIQLLPQQVFVINTNIKIQLPRFTYGRIAPRSGLAFAHGIDVLGGVIDVDFRGTIQVMLIKHSPGGYEIKKGDRIAQLIIERIANPDIQEVEQVNSTPRSTGGFGSTGK